MLKASEQSFPCNLWTGHKGIGAYLQPTERPMPEETSTLQLRWDT